MKNLIQYEIPIIAKLRTLNGMGYFSLLALMILFSQCSNDPETDICLGIECGDNGECIDGSCLCEEDYYGENCEKKRGLLKSVSRDGKLRFEMDYAPDHSLKTIRFISLNGVDAAFTYNCSWLGDTVRVDLEEEPDFHMKFYVENENQVFHDEISHDVLESRDIRIYNQCGVSQHLSYYDDGILQDEDEYEFIDNNCSFIQVDGNRKTTVLIDNNKGVFGYSGSGIFYISLIDYQLKSNGNVIQRTVEVDNVIQESITYTSEYQFNNDGYPLEETRSFLDGDVEVYTFTYWD